jgi:hypothetical protein
LLRKENALLAALCFLLFCSCSPIVFSGKQSLPKRLEKEESKQGQSNAKEKKQRTEMERVSVHQIAGRSPFVRCCGFASDSCSLLVFPVYFFFFFFPQESTPKKAASSYSTIEIADWHNSWDEQVLNHISFH